MSDFSSPGVDLSGSGFDPRHVSPVNLRMRALANPGPGFVVWIVKGRADFAGASAPAPIQAGTAVVEASWV